MAYPIYNFIGLSINQAMVISRNVMFIVDVLIRISSLLRYKNIIQLWTGCPPSGMWFGEGCLVII